MSEISTSKIFKWISFGIYCLAGFGLASIVFEAAQEQPLRFQYRSISPAGVARTTVDFLELASLAILALNCLKKFRLNSSIVLTSSIIYTALILVDINTWLFLTNEDFMYGVIIIVESLPLILFAYHLHIFKKECRGFLIMGVIAFLVGFMSHYYFYKLAVERGYRSAFYYDYPALLTLIGWICFIGALFTIVSVLEFVDHYRRRNERGFGELLASSSEEDDVL